MIHVVGTPEENDRLTPVIMASPTDWRRIAPAVTFIRPAGFVLVAFARMDVLTDQAEAHLYHSPLAPGDLGALHGPRGDVVSQDEPRPAGATRSVDVGHALAWDDAVVQINGDVPDEDLAATFEAAMAQMTQWYPLADEAPDMGPYGLLA